jgi:hypothetical protein
MQEKKEKELAGEIRLEEIRKAISPDRPPRGTGVYGQYCWALVMQKQAGPAPGYAESPSQSTKV